MALTLVTVLSVVVLAMIPVQASVLKIISTQLNGSDRNVYYERCGGDPASNSTTPSYTLSCSTVISQDVPGQECNAPNGGASCLYAKCTITEPATPPSPPPNKYTFEVEMLSARTCGVDVDSVEFEIGTQATPICTCLD